MAEPLVRRAGLLEDETKLHVLPLSILLLDQYGPTYLEWTSEALREELQKQFGEVGQLTWERIQVARVLHINNAFWQDWEVFEKCTAVTCGEMPVFDLVQPPEPEEIAVAIDVAKRIDNSRIYSPQVQDYIVASCLTDGLWYLESPLREVAGEAMSRSNFKGAEADHLDAEVAQALKNSDQYVENPEDAVSVQVNRVLDVRLVLKRYTAQAEAQLRSLPELLKRTTV